MVRGPIWHKCTLSALCLVLSGSGSDGAAGLSRIKEQSGITLAQVTEGAEFDGMPRAAIETGMMGIPTFYDSASPRPIGFQLIRDTPLLSSHDPFAKNKST